MNHYRLSTSSCSARYVFERLRRGVSTMDGRAIVVVVPLLNLEF